MTVIINLFAGPGSGKSTSAAGLFFEMKSRGLKVELVTEYAKELTYENNTKALENQLGILAEQDRRQRRLLGHVDYVITDSPLLIGTVFATGIYASTDMYLFTHTLFNSYTNFNVWIDRVKPYLKYGRSQTESAAHALDVALRSVVNPYLHGSVPGDRCAPTAIISLLEEAGLIK